MKTIKTIGIFFLIVVVLFIGCAKKTPQDKLEEARQALRKKDVLAAIIILEEILEKYPDDPAADDAHILLAEANYASGDMETCRKHLDAIINKYGLTHPKGAMCFFNKLVTYQKLKQWDDGIAFIKGMIDDTKTTGPIYWQLHLSLGDFYKMKGDKRSAIKIFKQISEQAQDESSIISAIEARVGIYESDKDYKSAADVYASYLASHPDTPLKNILLAGMAYYQEKMGNHDKAESIYAQAIKGFEENIQSALTDEQKVDNMLQLAKLYTLKTDYKQALVMYDKVLKEFPSNQRVPTILLEEARLYAQQKNYDRARQILNQILRRWPRTPIARTATQMIRFINTQQLQPQAQETPTTPSLSSKMETQKDANKNTPESVERKSKPETNTNATQ